MKYKLSRIALLALLAWSPAINPQSTIAQTPQAAVPNGQRLMQEASKTMAARKTVEAKMRVRTDLLGQPLVGSGDYAQLRSSSGLLLRMDLAIQAGEQATSVKQISDGRHLWEHWRIGNTERLNHVDLLRVEQAVAKAARGTAIGPTTASLGSGGLPKLLAQLEKNFDFTKAVVKNAAIGNLPMQVAVGVWKEGRLAAMAPDAVKDGNVAFDKLPAHLPHQIEVYLGTQDLFPYRVTYHRKAIVDGKHVLVPTVTTEFFGVATDDELDATQFEFQQPNDVSVADRTDAFLQTLGIATRPGDSPVRR